ncbi:MAG: hypothetical protein P1V97_04645, partial [Planctomycetota bacterium]|nr:hypothetical protein [Planctomycetota bacterium]
HFVTEQNVQIKSLCQGFGVPHRAIQDLSALDHALQEPRDGLRVIEAVVNRDHNLAMHKSIHGKVDDFLTVERGERELSCP